MVINNVYNIYESTLLIVGTSTLVAGLTLLLFCSVKKQGRIHNKTSLVYLAMTMLFISFVDTAEYLLNDGQQTRVDSFALVIFAAAIELFLFYFAYVSMLSKEFITRQRLLTEMALIVVFTVPPLFVTGVLFNVLFTASLLFYFVKLIINVVTYRRYLRSVTKDIQNYFSRESSDFLNWINRTFVVVLAIGTVSVIVPLTNIFVLTGYSCFIFFSYLYIYVEVVLNIRMFDASMEVMNLSNRAIEIEDDVECESKAITDKEPSVAAKSVFEFIPERQKLFNKWLADREYSDPDLNIDDIVKRLKITRNRLTTYINNDLKMSYYDWLALIRIEDAKKKLIYCPELTISEIGKSVGIEDKSNFSRVFKRYMNITPSDYRNKMK